MRVVHTVPAVSVEASGPSYSVPALCAALSRAGSEVELHVVEYGPETPRIDGGFELRVHPASPFLRTLLRSPSLKEALSRAADGADVLHNHSLWLMPNVYPADAVRGTSCRLVTSPRGTLSPVALRRSRWKKRLMWTVCQKHTLLDAALLHATSERELEDVRAAGLRAPVAVIPNGVDLPAGGPEERAPGGRRRLLYLGRIHPIKGLENLVRAWTEVERDHPDWELHVAGPDAEGHRSRLEELARSLGTRRLIFAAPAYGEEKSRVYRQADLYVLPSSTENFGITVAEALAHGLPAVATRHGPWADLGQEGCGWPVDFGAEPLAAALREALACSPDELHSMGERGRDWMRRSFSWDEVGRQMQAAYEWLLGGGAPPAWVHD